MSQSTVFLDTELRKLRPAELCTLGQILNISDSWKKLMAIIPKTEDCDFPKFHSEHFSMIEQAAQQQRRNAAEIFLSEWGTMGKKRPTLRILLNLLVKAELFRAADYIAGNILKAEELPKRPEYGPAAPIDISDEEIKKLLEEDMESQNTYSSESLIFKLPSDNNDNKMANPNAIDNVANNNSLQRNMQSTKLISTKEEHNDKCLDSVENQQQKGVNTLNINNSNLQRRDFRDQELPSCELPLPLMEFELDVKQTTLNGIREVQSDELPIVLNDSISSTDSLQVNPTNSSSSLPDFNFNRNELVTAELPQCIVEFGCTTNPHNINFNEENMVQNELNSQELPITVLAYNE